MKIALVLDDSIDRPDGVQQYALTVGRWLIEQGHEVHYVCSEATRDDVTVHSLARNMGVSFNGNGLRIPLPTSRRAIRAFLDEQRYDVIHVQIPHSPLFGARVVDEARRVQARTVRVVGTFHILPTGRVSEAGTRALGVWLRRNLRRFDQFCAVSAPAAQFARAAFGIDARVIPNAVDIAAFAGAAGVADAVAARAARAADAPVTLAFLGRLVERKGAVELVRALAELDPAVRDRLRVRIGGKGPMLKPLEAAIEAADLGPTVELVGFVSEENKPRFYAEADLAVFPATGGESFGIVLIEAMAAGAGVVVGGDNPGYRSVLGDDAERAGTLVDPRDSAAMADAITALVEDPGLRTQLHKQQAEHVRRYDIDVVGPQLLELYGRPS